MLTLNPTLWGPKFKTFFLVLIKKEVKHYEKLCISSYIKMHIEIKKTSCYMILIKAFQLGIASSETGFIQY